MKTEAFFNQLHSSNLSEVERLSSVSRQALHSAVKTRNMRLQNLESVAKALHYQVEVTPHMTEENLLASLKDAGVPVAQTAGGTLALEEALAAGVTFARKEGLYESLVPYALAVNANRVRWRKLLGLVLQNGEVNTLGYFAEMAHQFRPHPALGELLRALQTLKSEDEQTLVRREKVSFPELFRKNRSALKWNLLVRGTVDDHFARWKKWEASRKRT